VQQEQREIWRNREGEEIEESGTAGAAGTFYLWVEPAGFSQVYHFAQSYLAQMEQSLSTGAKGIPLGQAGEIPAEAHSVVYQFEKSLEFGFPRTSRNDTKILMTRIIWSFSFSSLPVRQA
jgi:hypothetical protein